MQVSESGFSSSRDVLQELLRGRQPNAPVLPLGVHRRPGARLQDSPTKARDRERESTREAGPATRADYFCKKLTIDTRVEKEEAKNVDYCSFKAAVYSWGWGGGRAGEREVRERGRSRAAERHTIFSF